MISPSFGDVYLFADARAILAYLRAQGGPSEIHASMFDMSSGEFAAALYHLKAVDKIRRIAPSIWEVVE